MSPATPEQMFCVAHHFMMGTVLPDQPRDDCRGEPKTCRGRSIVLSIRAGELIAGDFGDLAAFGLTSLVTGDRFTVALARLPFGVGKIAGPNDHQGHLLTDPAATGRDVVENLVGKTFIVGISGSFVGGNADIWSTEFRARIEAELKRNKPGCPRLQRS
jgi:hypothetical protein